MSITETVTVITSAVGLSVVTAGYLSRKLVEHQLNKDIELRKSELQSQLITAKATLEAKFKEEVETVLGNRAADREYELDARKRLYEAIGPLRFQLLLACRDLSGRIIAHGIRTPYSMDVDSYYGKSSLFRILRPLALTELIERQITYADFSIDKGAIELLRFKKSAFATFSGGSLVKGHSKVSWDEQIQHVFFDYLTRSANALIIKDKAGKERCMRFDEFEAFLEKPSNYSVISPFPRILKDFTPTGKPLFWLRLVGYAYLCNEYINHIGVEIGFETRELNVEDLIKITNDKEILNEVTSYVQRCESMPDSPL